MLDREIDHDLREQLTMLHNNITHMRQRGDSQVEVEQTLDMFEGKWFERIDQEHHAEVNGNANAVAHAVDEILHQKRFNEVQRDTALLKTMSAEQQVAFWISNHNSPIAAERDKARVSQSLTNEVTDATNARFHELRMDMTRAVDQIREGHEPTLRQETQHAFYEKRRSANHAQRTELLAILEADRENLRANDRER